MGENNGGGGGGGGGGGAREEGRQKRVSGQVGYTETRAVELHYKKGWPNRTKA